jgi:hypothetical protein
MYLQLAEKRKKGDVFVGAYKRKSSVLPHTRRYPHLHDDAPVYLAGDTPIFLAGAKARKNEKQKMKKEKQDAKIELKKSKEERRKNRKPIDFGGIIDSASGLVGKFKKGGGSDEQVVETPPETKPFYKNPIVIVGGILAVGGLIYLGTRKK